MTIGAPQFLLAVSVSPARRDLLYTSAARCSTQGIPPLRIDGSNGSDARKRVIL